MSFYSCGISCRVNESGKSTDKGYRQQIEKKYKCRENICDRLNIDVFETEFDDDMSIPMRKKMMTAAKCQVIFQKYKEANGMTF